MRKDQPEKAREILFNLVDTQIEELEAKFQTFVENAESDGKRSVDRLCFDGASEGKEMRKFELKYFGAYYRSVEAYKKYQRQNGGRGPGGGGKDEVDALDAAAWREFLPARCRRPELKSQEAYDLEAQAGDIDWARTAETNTVEVATPECEPLTLPGENGRNVTNDPNLDEGALSRNRLKLLKLRRILTQFWDLTRCSRRKRRKTRRMVRCGPRANPSRHRRQRWKLWRSGRARRTGRRGIRKAAKPHW